MGAETQVQKDHEGWEKGTRVRNGNARAMGSLVLGYGTPWTDSRVKVWARRKYGPMSQHPRQSFLRRWMIDETQACPISKGRAPCPGRQNKEYLSTNSHQMPIPGCTPCGSLRTPGRCNISTVYPVESIEGLISQMQDK